MADYHSLLMRAVANLPNSGTPASRGALYERARKALLEQLRSLRPPLPESDIAREEAALDAAIAEIENRYGPRDVYVRRYAGGVGVHAEPRRAAARPGAAPVRAAPPPRSASVQRPSAPTASDAAVPAGQPRPPSQTGVASSTRRRKRARSGQHRAETFPARPEREPTSRRPAASADPGRREAGRSDAHRRFASPIAARRSNGQPALVLPVQGWEDSSVCRSARRQGRGYPRDRGPRPRQGDPAEQGRRCASVRRAASGREPFRPDAIARSAGGCGRIRSPRV